MMKYARTVECPTILNPNIIGGGGKIGHATPNLVKSARVRRILTLLSLNELQMS